MQTILSRNIPPSNSEDALLHVGLLGARDMKTINLAVALLCAASLALPAAAQNSGHGRGADKADKADKGGSKNPGGDGLGQGRGQGQDKGPSQAAAPAVVVTDGDRS
eukprot:gene4281-5463_t